MRVTNIFVGNCACGYMDEHDLMEIEITHADSDAIIDAYAAGASKFSACQHVVIANRLLARQPNTELRALAGVNEEEVKLLEH